jgi:hypothetical protein
MHEREVTLLVVSHAQNALVNQLHENVHRACADRGAQEVDWAAGMFMLFRGDAYFLYDDGVEI